MNTDHLTHADIIALRRSSLLAGLPLWARTVVRAAMSPGWWAADMWRWWWTGWAAEDWPE